MSTQRLGGFTRPRRAANQADEHILQSHSRELEARWRQSGMQLAEATLLMAEGKHAAAEKIFADLRRTLPPEVRSLVAGP